MVGSEELSGFRQTVVIVGVAQLGAFLLGIDHHATELVDVERTSETANTFLLVDGRTVLLALDGDIAKKEKWRE